MICSVSVAPRPPCSRASERPTRPASCSVRCQRAGIRCGVEVAGHLLGARADARPGTSGFPRRGRALVSVGEQLQRISPGHEIHSKHWHRIGRHARRALDPDRRLLHPPLRSVGDASAAPSWAPTVIKVENPRTGDGNRGDLRCRWTAWGSIHLDAQQGTRSLADRPPFPSSGPRSSPPARAGPMPWWSWARVPSDARRRGMDFDDAARRTTRS